MPVTNKLVNSIDIDGDTAFVKSTLHARHFPEGGKRSQEKLMIGQYRYVLKKTSKGWRINHMRLLPSRKK
ncbi:nuclear transport factor 2 family protein [Colwelliaceae bacterium BS250]